MKKATESAFRFKSLDSIGAAAAEEDGNFLHQCFVDTGALEALKDCEGPKRIVVGRTGTGKTALMLMLQEQEDRAFLLPPESLALNYISNSTILSFLAEIGVDLDIFFKLLWRHVFAVELFRRHFLADRSTAAKIMEKLRDLVDRTNKRSNQRALDYLEKWGSSFWEETDYRIKEVTTTLENNIAGELTAGIPSINLQGGVEAARRLNETERIEVSQRAQKIVNQVQIKELSDVINLIATVLDDPYKRYYIIIDRLDENWVEEKLRYRLVRALIETARDFQAVRNAKIIIALRVDLLDRVFRLTRDNGFQEEKYDSLFLRIRWTNGQLTQLLDKRIGLLIKKRYESKDATHRDVLPQKIRKQDMLEYFLGRTLGRPRDVIVFFNECIQKSIDAQRISAQLLIEAEGEYSRNRLRSLADEWSTDYPNFMKFVPILKNRPSQFPASDLSHKDIEDFCLKVCIQGFERRDLMSDLALEVVECQTSAPDFRRRLISYFYKVGLVGLKLEHHRPIEWTLGGRPSISPAEIESGSSIAVHPMFWRVLGITPGR